MAQAVEIATQLVQLTVTTTDNSTVFNSLEFSLQNEADLLYVLTEYQGPGGADVGIDVVEINSSASVVAVGRTGIPSSLRYIDAMPGLDALTITATDLIQGSATSFDLNFGQASGRQQILSSAYGIVTTPTDNVGAIILDTTLSAIGGIAYTLILTGDLSEPESFLLVDDTRVVSTHAKLGIVHAAESLPESDVYIAPFGGDIFVGTKLADMLYRTSRDLIFADGLYNITVTTEGSESILVGPITVDLSRGSITSVLIRESVNGDDPYGLEVL
ncbi:MAG: DUF4397 domain-containing protein [Pseudomonadota bacterium]